MKVALFLAFSILLYPFVQSPFQNTWDSDSGEELRHKVVFHILAWPDGDKASLEVVRLSELQGFVEQHPQASFVELPTSGELHVGDRDRYAYESSADGEAGLLVSIRWSGDDYSSESHYRVADNTVLPLAHQFNHGMMIMAGVFATGFIAWVLSLLLSPLVVKGAAASGLSARCRALVERCTPPEAVRRKIRWLTRASTIIYLWPSASLLWTAYTDTYDLNGLLVVGSITLIVILLMALLVRGVFRGQKNALILHAVILAGTLIAVLLNI